MEYSSGESNTYYIHFYNKESPENHVQMKRLITMAMISEWNLASGFSLNMYGPQVLTYWSKYIIA